MSVEPLYITVIAGIVIVLIIYLFTRKSKPQSQVDIEKAASEPQSAKRKEKKQKIIYPKEKQSKKGEHPHPFWYVTLKDFNDTVPQISFSPDGFYLYAIGLDRTIRSYIVEDFAASNHKYYRNNIVDGVPSCMSASVGKYLVVCANNSPQTFVFGVSEKKGKDGKAIHEIKRFSFPKEHKGEIISIDMSKNSKYIVTCSSEDTVINVWDLKGQLLQHLKINQIRNNFARFSPDSNAILVGTHTSELKAWKIIEDKSGNFKELGKFYQLNGHKRSVNSASYSSDNKRLVTTSNDGSVKYWNLDVNYQIGEEPKCLSSFSKEGYKSFSKCEIAPNSKYIAVTSLSSILIFDSKCEIVTEILNAHDAEITSISWSPDSSLLASSSIGGLIRIWRLP